ncbi:hypothetical protein MG293_019968, partial [Ovis ammon polii]
MASELIAFCTSTRKDCLTLETLNSFEHEVRRNCRQTNNVNFCVCSVERWSTVLRRVCTLESDLDSSPNGSQKRTITTPETPLTKRSVSARSPHQLLSPSSFSPSATPPQKYSSRSNRGEVVTSFGSAQGVSWSGSGGTSHLSLKVLGHPEPLTRSYKYMFQKLPDIREGIFLTCKIEELGSELKEHYKIEAFAPILVPAQEPVTLLGQIGCDSNGKLNHKSVILEGDLEHSSGTQIPVDLSELKEYSLFPGQVRSGAEGLFLSIPRVARVRLLIESQGILSSLSFLPPSQHLLINTLTILSGLDSEQFMVLVACGPYTTSDSITFDPLLDLITIINRDRPDVCILVGPLRGQSCLLTSSFEDVFKQCLRTIIEGTRSSGSHLIFVPSLRDVHHEPVYPQPPFSCSDLLREDKKRVRLVSEPCTLSINGVTFGLTSTDLLFHMGAEEITAEKEAVWGRLPRPLLLTLSPLCSYYPLYPPQEDVAIDYENFYLYAQLPVTPDVFIAPSELRYFVK